MKDKQWIIIAVAALSITQNVPWYFDGASAPLLSRVFPVTMLWGDEGMTATRCVAATGDRQIPTAMVSGCRLDSDNSDDSNPCEKRRCRSKSSKRYCSLLSRLKFSSGDSQVWSEQQTLQELKRIEEVIAKGRLTTASKQLRRALAHTSSPKAKAQGYELLAKVEIALKNYRLANRALNNYLTYACDHREFAWEMKLRIADYYRLGGRERLFGKSYLPRIFKRESLSIDIYDEIIHSCDLAEVSRQAYLGRGIALRSARRFSESVEDFRSLCKENAQSASRDEVCREAYEELVATYLEMMEYTSLGDYFYTRVTDELSRLDRQHQLQSEETFANLDAMKELAAGQLYQQATLYTKRGDTVAAQQTLYRLCLRYPKTVVASNARGQLTSRPSSDGDLSPSEDSEVKVENDGPRVETS